MSRVREGTRSRRRKPPGSETEQSGANTMSSSYFCVSVAFLDPAFHGRRDGGELEWPPSPLRLFQALLAASAARWRESLFHDYAVPALKWLERQPARTSSLRPRKPVPPTASPSPTTRW